MTPTTAPAPAPRPRPDFVNMQLTAEGIELAQGGSLTISGPRRTLTFKAGETTEVERSFEYPWLRDHAVNGEYLFELVPGQIALVVPAPRLPGGTTPATSQGAPLLNPTGPLVDMPADEQTGEPVPDQPEAPAATTDTNTSASNETQEPAK